MYVFRVKMARKRDFARERKPAQKQHCAHRRETFLEEFVVFLRHSLPRTWKLNLFFCARSQILQTAKRKWGQPQEDRTLP